MKAPEQWPDPPSTALDAMTAIKRRLDDAVKAHETLVAEEKGLNQRLENSRRQICDLGEALDRAVSFWRGDVEPDDTMREYWKHLLQ